MAEHRFRFPAAFRLKSPEQFQAVYQAKKSAADERLLVFAFWNQLDHPRLGVSVSRKVGGAVLRNRYKRLFREAFRLSQYRLQPGLDLILIPRGAPTEPTLEALQESLVKLVQQIVRKLPPKPIQVLG